MSRHQSYDHLLIKVNQRMSSVPFDAEALIDDSVGSADDELE